jgi:hypothetical protein
MTPLDACGNQPPPVQGAAGRSPKPALRCRVRGRSIEVSRDPVGDHSDTASPGRS